MGFVNLVKLCVDTESIEDLADWHARNAARWPPGCTIHVTRMWPRREAELLNGGSLYWVIKGLILCRQRLLRLERREGADGITRCALVMDSTIVRTEARMRGPFQGWRYLAPEDAPRDLDQGPERGDTLPEGLARALAEIGLR